MLTEIEKKILMKMFYGRFIGERHTSEDNIPKGFPKHERGNVKKALKNLKRHGYIVPKITSYGMEVSLAANRISEIRKILGIE
jgi:hypothetical protein